VVASLNSFFTLLVHSVRLATVNAAWSIKDFNGLTEGVELHHVAREIYKFIYLFYLFILKFTIERLESHLKSRKYTEIYKCPHNTESK